MARRKRGRKVDGWVVVDKPVGITSTEVVARIKRLYDAQKAGHAGTLDPVASGCLPVALGEATKTVSYVMEGRKLYRFTVRWGVETDTDDTEGQPVATSEVRPDAAAIGAALAEFRGRISQVPPRYSAVKVAGERAYDLARSVVYTRQGNPANASDRDGQPPYRTTDIFYNAIDKDKVPIPYADVQMRMLARAISDLLADVMPMPRMWYFPSTNKTLVVLTADSHANPQSYFDAVAELITGGRSSTLALQGSTEEEQFEGAVAPR